MNQYTFHGRCPFMGVPYGANLPMSITIWPTLANIGQCCANIGQCWGWGGSMHAEPLHAPQGGAIHAEPIHASQEPSQGGVGNTRRTYTRFTGQSQVGAILAEPIHASQGPSHKLQYTEPIYNVDYRALSAQHWPTLANVAPTLANVEAKVRSVIS